MQISRKSGLLLLTLSTCSLLTAHCKSTHQAEENSESKGLFWGKEDKLVLPDDYESFSAEKKADFLFAQFERTRFTKLPALEAVNPLKFLFSHLMTKIDLVSDEAPSGYEKSIHAHGVAAKVAFEADDNPYTGLFQGAPHGIIRLSLTSDPKGKDFAPGLALKLLVDGQPSRNISALYKLSGQGSNHNFFQNELSNIIPTQIDPKSLFSMGNFGRVTINPTKIAVNPFAAVDAKGEKIDNPNSPVQIYFVPNHKLDMKTSAHDFRDDLLKIPEGTVLYDVYATSETGSNFRTIDEDRRDKAVKIGRLLTRSAFIASDFGDRRLFFRHYRYEDHN